MRYIFLSLMLLAMASCVKTINEEVPGKEPSLVINGFFGPDSTWQVNISESRNVLQKMENLAVTDATVSIYEGEILLETLVHNVNGYYNGQTKPKDGHYYTIKAAKQNFPTAEAREILPPAAGIDSIWLDSTYNSDWGQYVHNMRVKLTDNGSQKNFYHVILSQKDQFQEKPFVRCIYTEDPAVDMIIGYFGGNCMGVVLDDNIFNGQTYTLNLQLDNFWGGNNGEVEFFVELRSVSESYYQYMRTAMLQENSSYDPFAQPVQVYGNVNDGFGIWGSYKSSLDSMEWVW